MGSRAMIVIVALAACAGPRPQAHVVSVGPSPQAGHERVTVDVTNAGGHGQIDLRLVLRGADQPIPASRTLELTAHEHVQVTVDVAAPPGTYTASVAVEYPD